MTATTYRYPATEPAAAITIRRRLERAGLGDADNQTMAAWIHDLRLYEGIMATETRRLTFSLARTVDRDGVVREGDAAADDATLAELGRRVAALDAHGARIGKAVAHLNALLDRYEALGTDPATTAESEELRRRYIGRRVRTGDGPTVTLRDLIAEGWRLAVLCREGYRLLREAGKRDAVAAWGQFQDASGDGPLWTGHVPQAEVDDLDRRAARLGVLTLHGAARGR